MNLFKLLIENHGAMRIAARFLSSKYVARNPLYVFIHGLRIKHLTKTLEYPIAANIELTNNCNARCVMCSHPYMKRKRGFQTYELFQTIADQLADMGVKAANLTGVGEGMLDKNVFKKLGYAKKAGLPQVMLTTNASLLNGGNIDKLLATGIDEVKLSVDSIGEEFNRIRVGLDYEQIKKNIMDLADKRSKGDYKTRIYLNVLKMTDGVHDESRILSAWKGVVDGFNFVYYMNWGNVKSNVVKHGYTNKVFRKRPPCPYLWNTINIMWEGQVALCCLDYEVLSALGNVRDTSLKDIWRGKKMEEYRKAHLLGAPSVSPICGDCTWYPNWWA